MMEKMLKRLGYTRTTVAKEELAEMEAHYLKKLNAVRTEREIYEKALIAAINRPRMIFERGKGRKSITITKRELDEAKNYRIRTEMQFPKTDMDVMVEVK